MSSEQHSTHWAAPTVALTLLALNIYSIHKFTWTVASWWWFFVPSGALAMLSILGLLVAKLAVGRGKEEDGADEPVPESEDRPQNDDEGPPPLFIMFPSAALVLWSVFFGFIPFWANTWSATDPVRVEVQVRDSSQAVVLYEDASLGPYFPQESVVGTDAGFSYRGYAFEVYEPSEGAKRSVSFKVARGWLGWEFIIDPNAY